MTPLEYELLIEKITNWGIDIYRIQVQLGDGKNGEVQKLKLELFHFNDQLKRALQTFQKVDEK